MLRRRNQKARALQTVLFVGDIVPHSKIWLPERKMEIYPGGTLFSELHPLLRDLGLSAPDSEPPPLLRTATSDFPGTCGAGMENHQVGVRASRSR